MSLSLHLTGFVFVVSLVGFSHMYAPSGGTDGIVCGQNLVLKCNSTDEVIVSKVKAGKYKHPHDGNCSDHPDQDCYILSTVLIKEIRACLWKKNECVFKKPGFLGPCRGQGDFLVYSQLQCLQRNETYDICEAEAIYAPSGYIHSTDFPMFYPNENCKVTIVASQGHGITVTSIHTNIYKSRNEHEPNCTSDHLSFYSHSNQTYRFCGKEAFSFNVTGEKVLVEFITGLDHEYNRHEGFSFHFKEFQLPDETSSKIQVTTPEVVAASTAELTPSVPTRTIIIVASVLAGLLVCVVIAMLLLLIFYKRKKMKKHWISHTQNKDDILDSTSHGSKSVINDNSSRQQILKD